MKKNGVLEFTSDFMLFLISICWGSTFIIIKNVISDFPVFTFLFFRFLIASILLSPFILLKYKHINKKSLLAGVFLGFLLFLLFALQTIGLIYVKASVAAFITGTYIIFTPIFSIIILHKKPYKSSVYGVIIAMIGLFFITYEKNFVLSTGVIYLILNAIFLALHLIYVDKYSRKYNTFILTAFQFITMTVLSFLCAFIFRDNLFNVNFTKGALFAIFYTAIFASVVAYLIQIGMQKFTTPTKTAIMFAAEPLSAPFFSYFIGKEILNTQQLIGAIFIILAMVIAEVGTKNKYKGYAS
jgi:drug/metabolite transporter (DMT)-like permease